MHLSVSASLDGDYWKRGEMPHFLLPFFSSSSFPEAVLSYGDAPQRLGVSVSLDGGGALLFALPHLPADLHAALESALTCTDVSRHNSPGSFRRCQS
ncbi:hypothetical protein NDU88_007895 [Pleurodeles waltl]|uniref:Uncharacterized protein n=1 Tax=Pleurodeles waltl TaxID=8319 RepID=A0AAV7RT33_PLEWA|nr:hypothetical protein NDU88_007895 [Pleurodeles waltl]